MAISCDPSSLRASACGFDSIDPGLRPLVRILLLCNILNGTTMTCDAATLMAAAKCLTGLSYDDRSLVELILLCNIMNGTGGGAATKQQVLQDATAAPPPDPTKPAISFATGGGGISEWDVLSQTWI